MLCLIVLSWVKVNLKKKTENGHCHNPTHRTTQTNKMANCQIRSDFHGKLYSDYISMLEDFVESVKSYTPTPIASSSQQ